MLDPKPVNQVIRKAQIDVNAAIAAAAQEIVTAAQGTAVLRWHIGQVVEILTQFLKDRGLSEKEVMAAMSQLSKDTGLTVNTLIRYRGLHLGVPISLVERYPNIPLSVWLMVLSLVPYNVALYVIERIHDISMSSQMPPSEGLARDIIDEIFPPSDKKARSNRVVINLGEVFVKEDPVGGIVIHTDPMAMSPDDFAGFIESLQEATGFNPDDPETTPPSLKIEIKNIDEETAEALARKLSEEFGIDPDKIKFS